MAGQAKSGGSKMISEQNMFNLVSALMNAMGYQNVTDYITPPEQQPPPPPPDPMIEAQLEAVKVDTAVKQGELKVKEQKAETELMDVKMDNKFKLAELAAELETGRPMKIG
jgi:hypothetical protein